MNNVFKKLIGSGVLLAVPTLAFLALTTDTFAQFIDTNRTVIADGEVVASSASEVTVMTSGSEPITFDVNSRTVVTGDDKQVEVGDGVKAIGKKENGALVARVLQLSNDHGVGYGQAGDTTVAKNGEVVSKTTSSFTVETDATTTTYEVNSDTKFIKTSLSELSAGDTLQVIGEDTGGSFKANVVILKK